MGKPIDYLRPIVADADTVSSDCSFELFVWWGTDNGTAYCYRATVVLPPS
jgi:hypothetical protein